ncbi:MAG: hypothetical protein ILA29_01540 [Prevotella sp.]|nr:hypothetical protein [Prevotella sp.]
MKKVFFGIVALAAISFASCNQPKAEAPVEEPVATLDSAAAADSALKVLGIENVDTLAADSALKAQFDSICAALVAVPEAVEEATEPAAEEPAAEEEAPAEAPAN